MPRVSEFFGIVIALYFDDAGQHSRPHFHAQYGEHRAVFSIPDGDLLAGRLPRRQRRLVQAWAALHDGELEQAWSRALDMQPPGTIAPLR
jgi:hypothetical protein